MRLNPNSPWQYLRPAVLEPGQSIHADETALDRAVRDVARDWRDVFGSHPVAAAAVGEQGRDDHVQLVIGGSQMHALGIAGRNLSPEQWAIEVSVLPGGQDAVCLYGGGERGDIYALYEFSHRVLGIDRFHHWRDTVARHQTRLEAETVISEPPSFQWRGWFLNDEDLLTAWAPDPTGATGIAISTWDHVYETLLRCGGNFVVPGTFLFPDEAHLQLATQRGLALGQHHIEILGLNTFRWDPDVEYSYVTNRGAMVEAWREAVKQYGDREVVWSVGYRGKHDRPFWRDDRSVEDSAVGRGAVITDAIQTQVDLIREVRPNDTIVHHLWMEGVKLYQQGAIVLPEGVNLVWPDDGFGHIRDGGNVRAGDGTYYHVAMFNRFANQLTEAVPVSRIGSEFARFASADARSHVLINVSDIRPCLLGAEAAMDFAWTPPTPHDASSYTSGWARRLHGEHIGTRLAQLWDAYFDCGWRPTDDRPHRIEDNGYHTFSRMLLAELVGAGPYDFVASRLPELVPDDAMYRPFREAITSREAAELLASGAGSVQGDWDELSANVETFLAELNRSDRDVISTHLGMQVRFHGAANDMLHNVARAFLAIDSGGWASSMAFIDAAVQAIEDQLALLREMEIGRWRHWYAGDLFVEVPYTRSLIQRLIDFGPRVEDSYIPERAKDLGPGVLRRPDPYSALKAHQMGRTVGVEQPDSASP